MSLKMWRVSVTREGFVMAETEEEALEMTREINTDGEETERATRLTNWRPCQYSLVWHLLDGIDVSEKLAKRLVDAGATQAQAMAARGNLQELAERLEAAAAVKGDER